MSQDGGKDLREFDAETRGLLDQELQVVRPAQLPTAIDEQSLEGFFDGLLGVEAEDRVGDPPALVQSVERVKILTRLPGQCPRELVLRAERGHGPR